MLPAQHCFIYLWECGEEVGVYLQLKPVHVEAKPKLLRLPADQHLVKDAFY
jgi:hypothetical protein